MNRSLADEKMAKLLELIDNPSIEMQEMGSLASGYDLSQEQAARVWKAMASMMMTEVARKDHGQ